MEGTIGEVKIFAGNFAPRTWAFCEGQLMDVSQYTTLYSVLGTIYGGNGRTTFMLPDLRGRVPVGVGTGIGLDPVILGQFGGVQYHTLSINEMPQHTHIAQTAGGAGSLSGTATATMKVNNDEAETNVPSGAYIGKPAAGHEIYMDEATANTLAADAITVDTSGLTVDISGLSVTINQAGGSQDFSIMQPYLGMHWIICLDGVYPARS